MAVKALELAYVRIQTPDLEASERFFNMFGLPTRARDADRLYLRAGGPEHHVIVAHRGERRLLAIAFELAHADDLKRASELDGASPIEAITDPGGGARVVLQDPDGNNVELVHGIARTEPIHVPTQVFNSAADRRRRTNVVVRPHHGPSRVLRIGHVVPRSPDVSRLVGWYTKTLGLLESDDVPHPDGEGLLMSFVRLDQGETPVDHHVMQVLSGEQNQIHHISFEVQDIDDLQVGHHALGEAGYRHVWGIGRHLQGSQVFDYWLDPDGVMYEHWTDSDMLDASVAKGVTQLADMHSPWGPEMPHAFLTQGTK